MVIITFYGINLLPIYDYPTRSFFFLPSHLGYWEKWADWDGSFFLSIAEQGYIPHHTPFFPLYPVLIKTVSGISALNSFWSAFIISQLAAFSAVFFFYKLVLLDYPDDKAKKSVFLLLAFPTSFYLGAVYSEPLFLFFAVSAFYFARKKYWLASAILAGLASVTRVIGITVIIGIMAEYFLSNIPSLKLSLLYKKIQFRALMYLVVFKLLLDWVLPPLLINHWTTLGIAATLSDLIYIPIIFLIISFAVFYLGYYFEYKKIFKINTLKLLPAFIPLLILMFYFYSHFSDPLIFMKAHEDWGRYLTFPLNTVINHFHIIKNNLFITGHHDQLIAEFFFFLITFITCIISLLKLRASYYIYFTVYLLITLSSGGLLSFPRIALGAFPMFIVLSLIKSESLYNLWLFLSLTFLGILSVMFINSFWVA